LAITESFAAGNVTVRRGASGTGWISAGGLVGFLGHSASIGNMQQSSIADSYALGNVIVDNPFAGGASLFAGGLVGRMQVGAAYAIDRSFAAGSASARNNATVTTSST